MLSTAGLAAACAPATAPSPTAAPAKPPESAPTAAPASKPVELAKPAASPVAAAPAASPTSVARRGGTLRVGLASDVITFDPHYSTGSSERHVYYAIYNTLVGLDAQLRAVPELAESVDQPDAKTIIFHL